MGDLFLTIYVQCMYVCAYVRTYVVHTYIPARSGIKLRVSCWPIEFYLLRGLDGARTTTLRNRSVDERAVLQGLQSWSSYIWSQTATYGVKQSPSLPHQFSLDVAALFALSIIVSCQKPTHTHPFCNSSDIDKRQR